MKLAMAQMCMTNCAPSNLERTCTFIQMAADAGNDFIFFPEIQLTPFFPQYNKAHQPYPTDEYVMPLDGFEIREIRKTCADSGIWASPNVYLDALGETKGSFDASLMINSKGNIVDAPSAMVHVAQAPLFYEQDYYTPSPEGFRVYDTPWGRIGIVICYDRHEPESIRTCAMRGADLVIVPTANITREPLDMFEWEMRVQAYQNGVFVAMCNRTGEEGDVTFAGESLVCDPHGNIVVKAGADEELVECEIDLSEAAHTRAENNYLGLRRPEMYG